MLEVKVEKNLPNFRLKVDLWVKKREYIVILGRSGAGKSLTAKIIAGIVKPDYGKIFLNGKDISHLPPEKRKISYLPQVPSLFPNYSVRENLEFPFKVKGNKPDEKVEELAARFGILHLFDKRPSELSGGEGQRVALARALLAQPQVLILDEPLSSLDFITKLELIEFLHEIKGKTTVIHITHDPLEAKELSDRVLYIEKGELLFNGSWEKFLGSRWELPEKIREYLSP